MLKPDILKEDLLKQLNEIFTTSFNIAHQCVNPSQSEQGEKDAQKFAETANELISPVMAEVFSKAIDAYVKNIQLSGTFITNGSPSTHTGTINSTPVPATNGSVPNTLGIK